MPYRIVAGVLGGFFLIQGLQWLVSPADSAAALGMSLLEGAGRSTQIGDIASFFLCAGAFALYGAARLERAFVRAAGCLVGLAAVTRTVAWAFHDAPFAATFITIEVLIGGALLFCAARLPAASSAPDPLADSSA